MGRFFNVVLESRDNIWEHMPLKFNNNVMEFEKGEGYYTFPSGRKLKHTDKYHIFEAQHHQAGNKYDCMITFYRLRREFFLPEDDEVSDDLGDPDTQQWRYLKSYNCLNHLYQVYSNNREFTLTFIDFLAPRFFFCVDNSMGTIINPFTYRGMSQDEKLDYIYESD